MKKLCVLASILSVTGWGAIVENINSLQTTFYYSVENSKVSIKQCDVAPTSELDVSQCRAVTGRWLDFAPIPLDKFAEGAKAWGQIELGKIQSTIAEARQQIAQKRKQVAAIDEIIKGLPQGSPALSDYQDRRRDVNAQIAKLEASIATGEGQLGGFDLLFGQNGFLAQELLHPIAAGQSTYVAVRPFVKHFLDVFKYQASDPMKSVIDAKADLIRFKAEDKRPYCAYWNGGTGRSTEIDSRREGIIRTLVSLNRAESFSAARASCQALGMDLAVAAHIPGYHSHLWADGSEQETWTVEQSTKMFADTALAKGLPNYSYSGQALKIFWVQMTWYSRYHKPGDMDAFFMNPAGDYFRFNDGEDEGGVGVKAHSLPVSPDWNLSVVCEKQYPTLPRYIDAAELKDCVNYIGWP